MTVKLKYKLKPFDHQIDALEFGWDRPEFGLFMEMGTGKSKVLIDNMGMLYLDGQIDFALVIAPKGVYGRSTSLWSSHPRVCTATGWPKKSPSICQMTYRIE